jgi:hypothetical protein
MSDKKISDLSANSAPAIGDLLLMVDVSDTSMGASGTDKKFTVATLLGIIYPIGCIYTEITGVNPGTTFGFGTWAAWGTGQVPVGVDINQTEFNTVEKTGGEKTHALTEAELATHTHIQNAHQHGIQSDGGTDDSSGNYNRLESGFTKTLNTVAATATNQNTGSGTAHNNLQPFITWYMWKRTA